MITPLRGKILAELLPSEEHFNKIGLVIVDKKKHFEHSTRRGKIIAVGDGVDSVKVGDIVLFRGDACISTDMDWDDKEIKNENYQRWIKESDCLCLEYAEEVAI
jgi:co-chaperonin GroES (HSP10)